MPLTQAEAMRLLMAHRVGLSAYLSAVLADRHLTEDALQQLSVVLLKRYAQIPDADAFLPWARRAARFEALALLRERRAGKLSFDDDLTDVIDRYWAEYDAVPPADALVALEACLDHLPEDSLRLIRWRFADDLACGDIAVRVGRSAGAVRVALSRVYDRLESCVRKRLAAAGVGDG